MLQESQEKRATRALDLLLAVALILLVLFVGAISRAAALYAQQGIVKLVLFSAFVIAGGLFYTKRLLSYRYTYFYEEPEPGSEYPFPIGTLLFEQMVGDRAQTCEVIDADEMIALLAPAQGCASIGYISLASDGKPPHVRKRQMTTGPRHKAHALLFCRQGKYYFLYFNPSPQMARLLGDAIAAAQKL